MIAFSYRRVSGHQVGVAVARKTGCVLPLTHQDAAILVGTKPSSLHVLCPNGQPKPRLQILHCVFDEAPSIRMTGAAESMCSLVIVGMASPHGSKGGPIYGPRVQGVRSSSTVAADPSKA